MTLRITIAATIAILWVSWILALYTGSISSLLGTNNYQILGAFGDSFGVISSLMATIAAIGAYLTFHSQSEAMKLERFESNLFTLMSQQENIISEIVVSILEDRKIGRLHKQKYPNYELIVNRKIEKEFRGRRALLAMLFMLRNYLEPDDYKDTKRVAGGFDILFSKYVNNLAHYFRSTYHIFKYIEEKCPSNHQYYARMVRAKLSQAELCLIGYNCTVGLGRKKFARLLGIYSILHNLYCELGDEWGEAEYRFLSRKLSPDCFRYEPPDPVTY